MKADARALARALAGALASALVLASAAAQAAPDVQRGEQIYVRCAACHAMATDRVGPRHCGLFGRLAGTVPGFPYSAAMKKSKITWDDKTLEQFLRSPTRMVRGTTMTYDGVESADERQDLIAYLRAANQGPECRAH